MSELSLYGQYVQEREGKQIIENECGFATYKIFGEECYVVDIFIKKEFRRSSQASGLADHIALMAKEAGCKFLTGTCAPSTFGATESMKAMFGYGFKLHSCTEDKIILIKEL